MLISIFLYVAEWCGDDGYAASQKHRPEPQYSIPVVVKMQQEWLTELEELEWPNFEAIPFRLVIEVGISDAYGMVRVSQRIQEQTTRTGRPRLMSENILKSSTWSYRSRVSSIHLEVSPPELYENGGSNGWTAYCQTKNNGNRQKENRYCGSVWRATVNWQPCFIQMSGLEPQTLQIRDGTQPVFVTGVNLTQEFYWCSSHS